MSASVSGYSNEDILASLSIHQGVSKKSIEVQQHLYPARQNEKAVLDISEFVMARPPSYVGMALGITSQDWSRMGLDNDPSVNASTDLNGITERITALLLIRIIAWIQPRGTFADLSTTTICRHILVRPDTWPSSITPDIMEQLQKYVHVILSGYNDVPYHNYEHCYHVTISANKLIDMIVNVSAGEPKVHTYGYRDDALMQFVQVFSALIHDVEHQGIPNRQLAIEDDFLAIQYNDQSIAEMRSLYVGFSELLKPDYALLRSVIFPTSEDYRRFRSATVNLVLMTDLASPDRAQIGKSKWKEAFGDPYETVERKVLKHMERRMSAGTRKSAIMHGNRRMSAQSIMSELTLETSPMAMYNGDGIEDDESISVTPDSSDNEEHESDKPMRQPKGTSGPIFRQPIIDGDGRRSPGPPNNRSPMLSPMLRAVKKKSGDSIETSSIRSDASGNITGMALKFHRRLSSIGPASMGASSKKARNTRLGLLRTVDLSGEAIETYSHRAARPSATGAVVDPFTVQVVPPEEVDPLRETVVMETIMKAADVAHNLQGWEQMAKWSNRLFLELKKAYVQGRGDDPQGGWFTNQIGFIEAYLLPLARKLDDTGVFGDARGSIFAEIVEESKDRWMREGASLTASIIREGHIQFPEAESDDDIVS